MSGSVIPVWIQEAKNVLVNGLGEVLPTLSSSTSENVYQGVVLSMLDYITLSDVLLLQADITNVESIFDGVVIPSTYPAVQNRINGMSNMLSKVLNFNIGNVYQDVNYTNLYMGESIFPSVVSNMIPSLIGWYGEIPVVETSLPDCASEVASQFSEYATNRSLTPAQQDVISHMSSIATYLSNYTNLLYVSETNPFPSFQAMWSQLIALKSYFLHSSYSYSNFMADYRQGYDVIRGIALLFAISNAGVFSSSSTVENSTVTLETLRQGETLQSFAQRTTGSFENWATIAQINNLSPPYINTGITPIPGLIMYGQKLFLPPGPQQVPTSYPQNILGTDLDFGPPGGDIPVWGGDIPLISGVSNYLLALLRRVMTPIKTYPYDSEYGSRLPYEVGRVSSTSETGRLASYLKATIRNDPRTADVSNVDAVFSLQTQSFSASCQVVPIGLTTPVNFSAQVSSASL